MSHSPIVGFDYRGLHFTRDAEPIKLTGEEIAQMKSYWWWHEIPFAPGVASPGQHSPISLELVQKFQLNRIDFKDKSVLDIGVNDGFYSFWAEAHGAGRIVGIDDLSQLRRGTQTIDFARTKLGSKLEFYNMNLYNLTAATFNGFDVVMMFGVLYHLVHPMLGIEKAAAVCKSDLLIETHFVNGFGDKPVCVLYPDYEYRNDYTNWSGPNLAWLKSALAIQGFKTLSVEIYNAERLSIHAKRIRNQHTDSDVLNPHRDTTFFNLGEVEEG